MDSEKADWGLAEWIAHAEALEAALDSAMEGWGSTVKELEQSGKVLAKINEAGERQNSLLSMALSLAEEAKKQRDIQAPGNRSRGRPRKVEDDTWLLTAFNEMKTEFQAANKFRRASDNAVLTWYFGREFERNGGRASHARSAVFQGKLKRFRNRLGDVRNPIRKGPI